MSEQMEIIPANWHSIEAEVCKGIQVGDASPPGPDGIGVAAVDCGGEICLMLSLAHDGESLAAVLPIGPWNKLCGLFQLAMLDGAAMAKARRQ